MTETRSGRKPSEVLIVDDTPANLELLSDLLRTRGYTVRAAVSGQLALEAVRNSPPDLILLDIMMPEMNGYQVCAELKSMEELRDIPVIFLSVLGETMDKVQAFEAGGVDYITKPFQLEEIEARVVTHLELRTQKRLLEEKNYRLVELERLRDNLMRLLAKELQSPLAAIGSCLEAVKMDKDNLLSDKSMKAIHDALKESEAMINTIGGALAREK